MVNQNKYRNAGIYKLTWPEHVAGQVLKIQDPVGQMSIAANRLKYGSPESEEAMKAQMRNSAIEVMVQAFRFLENN